MQPLRPTYRLGYNAALLDVRRRLAGMIAAGGQSPEAVAIVRDIENQCRQFRQRTRYKPRQPRLATIYGVCLRTLKNWKAAGCPFAEGHKAVLRWLAPRRSLPMKVRAKFAREFQHVAVVDAMAGLGKAEKALGKAKDLPAMMALADSVTAATNALLQMDGERQLRQQSRLLRVATVARRSGLWDDMEEIGQAVQAMGA